MWRYAGSSHTSHRTHAPHCRHCTHRTTHWSTCSSVIHMRWKSHSRSHWMTRSTHRTTHSHWTHSSHRRTTHMMWVRWPTRMMRVHMRMHVGWWAMRSSHSHMRTTHTAGTKMTRSYHMIHTRHTATRHAGRCVVKWIGCDNGISKTSHGWRR